MGPFDFFMPDPTVILNASALQRALARIAHEIAERNDVGTEVVLVGVQRGGVYLAQRLAGSLSGIWGHAVTVGSLDVGVIELNRQTPRQASPAGRGGVLPRLRSGNPPRRPRRRSGPRHRLTYDERLGAALTEIGMLMIGQARAKGRRS